MWKKILTVTPVSGQHSDTMVSTVACTVWLGPFSVELCVLVCFPFVDPFQTFQQKNPTNSITPNTVSGVRLTGDSKLALGVNVSAECLSLC